MKENRKPFEKYTHYYDVIHHHKDYDGESRYVERLFEKFASNKPKNILDLACGTGEHAIRLARAGYSVVGVDLCEGMIKKAVEKTSKMGLNVKFLVGDMRDFNLGQTFDCCICMFGGIGYLSTVEDLLGTFSQVRKHLKNNGLFIFDYWNGAAVLTIRPAVVKRVVDINASNQLIRIATPELDITSQMCKVHYYCIVKQGNIIVDEFEETHPLRFYFPQEIHHYLSDTGFVPLATYPFLELEGKPDDKNWNLITIAKAT